MNSVTPHSQNRSIVEDSLIAALDIYINEGHENEKQLARLAKDLIQLTGDQDIVIEYLNMKASKALEGGTAWA